MEKNVFEQMASKYDTEDRIALAQVITKEVREVLGDSRSESLIDYGSGTGLVSLELTDLTKSVLLVDSSEQMLKIAKGKIERRDIANADVLYSDFIQEKPEFKADIVLMSLVLLHIPDTDKILREMHEVLNEGGQLIIVDFDKHDEVSHPKVHNGFNHEELKNRLSHAGFNPLEIRTFHHGERIFMNRDASMFISISSK
ncbi:class I SAM-dependent methyltransferase [Bhargavaea ginsengi]|uniref:class I SAM-dependent methyltransferase n=1 Tax=Bhargavaea ginsengi TaxID=426757 RepID=UPI00203D69E9|nr:methyltransferase domain-containing protein [Bhargavaea ginsengi]MCM3087870.1 methyltransferase domain-containing protein [Bhargavaea ginsengi]